MQRLQEEAKAFGTQKLATIMQASRLAAMQLVCGIDLSAALAGKRGASPLHSTH